jgi:glutamyl-tRNA reductase
LISSTGSKAYVFTADDVRTAMASRRNRPLYLIDIAVPRDLDPAIDEVENAYLYDIDDLEGIVQSNLAQRQQEVKKIDALIAFELDAFRRWYKSLNVVPLISALQEKSLAIHEQTMNSLLNKLPDLDEHEIKVIRKLTRSIVNQMMQDPIKQIKEMAGERHGQEAMETFAQLFGLDQAESTLRKPAKRPSRVGELSLKKISDGAGAFATY